MSCPLCPTESSLPPHSQLTALMGWLTANMNEQLLRPDGCASVSSGSVTRRRQRWIINNKIKLKWMHRLPSVVKSELCFCYIFNLHFCVYRAQHGWDALCGHAGGRGSHRWSHFQGRVWHCQSGYMILISVVMKSNLTIHYTLHYNAALFYSNGNAFSDSL